VTLGDQATNNLALVFHELATNAAKYGALSRATGSVAVRWQVNSCNLSITWNETGGPAVAAPAKKGFGSALVDTTIVRSGGAIESTWHQHGLSVRITIPLNSLGR
jgi:two-component sensor histidine kinase